MEVTESSITAKRTWRAEEFFYEGHYPGNPLTPGVLLCEACFQVGAIFLVQSGKAGGDKLGGTPVLSRIQEATFKQMVRPGETVITEARKEDGKLALTLDFALALLPETKAE